MNVLILGARSPTSLEWARAFFSANWYVTLADSLHFPLARFTNKTHKYLHLPPPKQSPKLWLKILLDYVKTYHIDFIMPTCEEVFYLSAAKDQLPSYCHIFTSPFEQLKQLHHKGTFAQLIQNWNTIRAPETHILYDRSELDFYKENSQEWVFKPAFSRFSTQTLIQPSSEKLRVVTPNTEFPWIAQKFIQGKEYCSYSIFNHGKLIAHSCYHSRYRIGQGAGIYFEPIHQEEIYQFIEYFGAKTAYHGQVGFDFIYDAHGKFHVIECNPRATSGIHLLSNQNLDLIEAITKNEPIIRVLYSTTNTKMVTSAMILNLMRGRNWGKKFWADFKQANDIVWNKKDICPSLFQCLNIAELFLRSVKYRENILEVTTRDIQWDGLPIEY